MLEGVTIRIDGQRVRVPGVCWGYGDSDPYLIGKTDHYMVIRRKGVTDWESRNSSSYNPAEWILMQIKEEGGKIKIVKELITETPGQQWRQARTRLLAKMEELERTYR